MKHIYFLATIALSSTLVSSALLFGATGHSSSKSELTQVGATEADQALYIFLAGSNPPSIFPVRRRAANFRVG